MQFDIHAVIHIRHAATADQAVDFEAAKRASDRGIVSHGDLDSLLWCLGTSYGDLSDLVNVLIEALDVGI